eukprot:750989-Hanusia_phi.AAC.6
MHSSVAQTVHAIFLSPPYLHRGPYCDPFPVLQDFYSNGSLSSSCFSSFFLHVSSAPFFPLLISCSARPQLHLLPSALPSARSPSPRPFQPPTVPHLRSYPLMAPSSPPPLLITLVHRCSLCWVGAHDDGVVGWSSTNKASIYGLNLSLKGGCG